MRARQAGSGASSSRVCAQCLFARSITDLVFLSRNASRSWCHLGMQDRGVAVQDLRGKI